MGAISEPLEAPEQRFWQKKVYLMYKSLPGDQSGMTLQNGGKFKYLNSMIQITSLCSFPEKKRLILINYNSNYPKNAYFTLEMD